ncbi:MAG: hypothetical protein QM535_22555 [Limnohabitans sp.]|nr:hypothetical protein [Limnohabitans sp.]
MLAAVKYWRSGKKKNLRWTTVRNNYRFVTSERQLFEFAKSVDNSGNQNQKWREVSLFVSKRFDESIAQKLIVHDCDLKTWGIEKARDLQIPNFSISKGWLHNFKVRHRIVSRKVNKFISFREHDMEDDLKVKAEQFVASVKAKIPLYNESAVFNTDQSGFNLEMHSGRTLATKGVKNVERCVQQVNATTHSYTIQPVISADGILLSPMLVVLKEPSGKLSDRLKSSLFNASNIYVECSKSGKMGKEHLKSFFENVYFPSSPQQSLLLVDSWTVYKDRELIDSVKPENKSLDIMMIPPKTTGYCQPLDKFFFRPYKVFYRRITDKILILDLNIPIRNRNEIIKIHSLIHNQFSSPRYLIKSQFYFYINLFLIKGIKA